MPILGIFTYLVSMLQSYSEKTWIISNDQSYCFIAPRFYPIKLEKRGAHNTLTI
jgi:hypothetical protein